MDDNPYKSPETPLPPAEASPQLPARWLIVPTFVGLVIGAFLPLLFRPYVDRAGHVTMLGGLIGLCIGLYLTLKIDHQQRERKQSRDKAASVARWGE